MDSCGCTPAISIPSGRRLLVCDNFYTRHVLASAIFTLTDSEVRILGTVRLSLVDGWNRPALTESLNRMVSAGCGTWQRVAAIDPVPDWKKLQNEHTKTQNKLPARQRKEFKVPLRLAPCAGYVVLKKIVVFYTNGLAASPSIRVLDADSQEAVHCIHGLSPLNRWTGNEVMHQRVLNDFL